MTPPPFHSARTKIARARKLTQELGASISEFKGTVLNPERKGKDLALVIRLRSPLPDVAGVLGDAIHNLRAALDHMAVSVVALNGKSPNGVYFPFAHTADDLPEQIKRKNFHRAPQEAQELLVSLRPYTGGNLMLRALHDLDVLDKHNDLIPTYSGAVQKVPLHLPNGGLIASNTFSPVEEGRGAILLGGGAKLKIPPMPMGLVANFPREGPFPYKEIVPTLTSLAQMVSGIVDAFEALSLGEGSELSPG